MLSSGRSCPSGLSVPTTLSPNDLHLVSSRPLPAASSAEPLTLGILLSALEPDFVSYDSKAV